MASSITRRSFVSTLAAGLGATAFPLRASSNKLHVGVGTYSYHNLSLDEMIVQLKALKVAEIEMSRFEYMLMNHPSEELFRTARAKFDHEKEGDVIEDMRRDMEIARKLA
jgi:hypothetical protein